MYNQEFPSIESTITPCTLSYVQMNDSNNRGSSNKDLTKSMKIEINTEPSCIEDMCQICFQVPSMAVSYKKNICDKKCKCKVTICLECLSQHLHLFNRVKARYNPDVKDPVCINCNLALKIGKYELYHEMVNINKLYYIEDKKNEYFDKTYGKFECRYDCGKTLLRRDYNLHNMVCPNMPRICVVCGDIAEKGLIHHVQYDCSESLIRCEKCFEYIARCMKSRHDNDACVERDIECEYCNYTYVAKQQYFHMNTCPGLRKQCPVCLDAVYEPWSKEHAQVCLGQKVQCGDCGIELRRSALDKHQYKLCVERKHKCLMCDQMVRHKTLKIHNESCPGTLFYCPDCKKYVQRTNLMKHQCELYKRLKREQDKLNRMKELLDYSSSTYTIKPNIDITEYFRDLDEKPKNGLFTQYILAKSMTYTGYLHKYNADDSSSTYEDEDENEIVSE
jgi:hypothetical protein